MNIVTWLLTGAALGLLVSIAIRRRRSTLLLNMIVGMVGAFVAGYIFAPLFVDSIIDQSTISIPNLVVSIVGAVLLLTVVNFIRRENNVTDKVIIQNWAQVSDKIHTRWDKITDEDIAKIDGNHSRFVATLQARYGYDKNDAEDQIQRYLKSILVYSGRSFELDHRVQGPNSD